MKNFIVSAVCLTLILMLTASVASAQTENLSEDKIFTNNKHELAIRLEDYVKDELGDNLYYEELAKMAPTDMEKSVILGFANDEKHHAEIFTDILQKITRKPYQAPQIEKPVMPNNYRDALLVRIRNESNDYKKYGNEYLAAKNFELKNAFLRASMDENIHAERLLYLLELLDKQ